MRGPVFHACLSRNPTRLYVVAPRLTGSGWAKTTIAPDACVISTRLFRLHSRFVELSSASFSWLSQVVWHGPLQVDRGPRSELNKSEGMRGGQQSVSVYPNMVTSLVTSEAFMIYRLGVLSRFGSSSTTWQRFERCYSICLPPRLSASAFYRRNTMAILGFLWDFTW